MKYFIITVDTEGDNLWAYKGGIIGTKNAEYLPRFQSLCEKFGFKPVYLTNYEMIMSDTYCNFVTKALARNACEVGIHLHAWNTPPNYPLVHNHNQNSYLIEYPLEVREKKFKVLYDLIKEKLNYTPVSHRAGRWATDEDYFKMLEKFDITVDCSITPFVDWSKTPGEEVDGGNDYSNANPAKHKIGNVIEVPMSIRKCRYLLDGTLKHKVKTVVFGNKLWLRPAMSTKNEMKHLIDVIDNEPDTDYLEFMVHSSEVMPGGSPYFRDEDAVEKMFVSMEQVFQYAFSKGYRGITLREYSKL